MKKILLFGGSGLIGSRIQELLSKKYSIIAPTHHELDVVDSDQIEHAIGSIKPQIIIYSAAISNPDASDKNKRQAMSINALSPGVIARFAARKKIRIVYFSTDAVFSGDQEFRPYKEDDPLSPVNYYGVTKQKGEEYILDASRNNTILRLITVYSHGQAKKTDIARLAAQAFKNGKEFAGIIDQYFNPTYVDDAVRAVDRILEKQVEGILHFGSENFVSNYEFIETIARIGGFSRRAIKKVTFADFYKGRGAKRGKYVWLDTTKAKSLLGDNIVLPTEKSVKRFWQKFPLVL